MAIKFFIFLISPILSLLVSLKDILNGKEESTYIFALCMGVFAYLTAPASDLYPHYLIFESFHNISLPTMLLLLEEDVLIPFTDYVFVNNGINYEWIRFLICTFQYMVLAYVFNGCTEKMNLSSKRYLFLIVLLYTNFFGTFVGVRGPLAATFYFLAVYLLFLKKKKYTPILYFTLACLSHFFLISVTIFTILIYFLFRFRVNKKLLYLIIFSSFFLGSTIASYYVERFFPEQMHYINGYWGAEHTYSFKGLIFVMITRYGVLPLVYFFFKYNNKNEPFRNVVYFLIICFVLTISFNTISSRFLPLIRYLVLFYFLQNYAFSSVKLRKIILVFGVILQVSTLYTNRDFIIPSNNNYLHVWEPIPILFQNQFDDRWINANIDNDGLFINTSH